MTSSLVEDDFEMLNTEENLEREDVLRVIKLLSQRATSSARLVQYIQSALRIGKKFNLHYKVNKILHYLIFIYISFSE